MITDESAVGCEVTADEIIGSCLTEYGIHTHRTKITNAIDGLKPINRRVLLVKSDNIPRKVVAMTGSIMEKYHPYGDNAITNSITRMAQPYTTAINLMYSDSNVGDYGGAEEAAGRYLDVAASQFAIDVYIKGIDKNTFEYIPSEIGEGVEPKFFVPKLPMALLVANFGMGLAHKSEPATLNMFNVCKMVCAYIKLLQQYGDKLTDSMKYAKLAKYTLPDFPITVKFRNEKELMDNYVNGNFKVSTVVDGTFELTPNTITIKTLPYGVQPKEVYELLGVLRKENKPNFVNNNFQRIEDYSKGFDFCTIILTLKRGVSPFDVLDELKKTINFTKKWTPTYLFATPSDKIEYLDPIRIIEMWYNERCRSIKAELRSGQRKNVEEIRKLTALIQIGDNILDVVKILRNCDSIEEAYPILAEKYKLSRAQTMTIMKYQLASIPKRSHGDMIKELDNIKATMIELQNKFFNVDKQIMQDTEYFINKYPEYCNRRCTTGEYIGYVKIQNGIVQFESIDQMIEILTVFNKYSPKIYLYPVGHKHHFLLSNSNIYDEDTLTFPKEMIGDRIVSSKHVLKYTIGFGGGTIFRMNKLSYDTVDNTTLEYVGDKCVLIYKTGIVDSVDPLSIVLRNNVKSRGINTDIIHVANCNTDEVIVVHTHEANIIEFEKLKMGNKFIMPPKSIAKTTILGVFNVGETFVVTVDDELVNKCTTKHIYVEDPSIFDEGKVVIKLSSKSYKGLSVKFVNNAGLVVLSKSK